MLIRLALESDWPAIRRICVETGPQNLVEASVQEGELLADYWIEPYRRLWPDWTWVAIENGEVCGYMTVCPDTVAHESLKLIFLEIPQALKILAGHYGYNPAAKKMFLRLLRRNPLPQAVWGDRLDEWNRLYPAHLHINFDTKAQGRGWGRELMETAFRCLRANRIFGVHLFCGDAPVGFYRALGFAQKARQRLDASASVYMFARDLNPQ